MSFPAVSAADEIEAADLAGNRHLGQCQHHQSIMMRRTDPSELHEPGENVNPCSPPSRTIRRGFIFPTVLDCITSCHGNPFLSGTLDLQQQFHQSCVRHHFIERFFVVVNDRSYFAQFYVEC